ncbi:putative E3 ubiquitin-protein ligase rhb1a [Branchiostoma belcheri]|nr:putative E3 ubiquitin-protein ligase rhb1a [Branchiostoma belcheri]
MFFEAAQVILAATGVLMYLFHHRKHLQTLIWRPYVLLLFGLGTVFLLKNTSKLLCFATWLFFVCLHYFKDLQKGNESECPICFEDLKTSFPYECTRCKKATHARCVVEYLERSGEESFLCPFCRKDLRVKKEELKLAIERFEKLMGGEDAKERLENETEEDQPTTASEKRQGKLLSLLTALKTATLVSLMVTFYGSYQLFKDSYRALPGDLKTFAGVLAVDVVQFVHGPMRIVAQKMYGVALIVIKFIKEGTTKAAVVGFHAATQLSGAALRKMAELLLTSKIVFSAIMHSQVVENTIVPSVMYAGAMNDALKRKGVFKCVEMDRIIAQNFAMFFEPVQVILAATGALLTTLYLFHHRKHLQTLIWRPYVLLLFGLGTVFLLKNTSKLLCFAAWLFFVCLHYFKDLQKGNESECPICFEDLKTSCPYECTRCKKATHARCVVEYLERRGEESFRCPFCRKDLRVKKDELKLFIERFGKLMGDEDTNERLENETAEDQPTTASEKRQRKVLSLLTALKTATLLSLMVTFYGSYQLVKDSCRALLGDLKTFCNMSVVGLRT